MFSLRVLTVKTTRVKAKIALQKIQSNSSHEMVVQFKKKKRYTEGTKENCFKQTDTHPVLKIMDTSLLLHQQQQISQC